MILVMDKIYCLNHEPELLLHQHSKHTSIEGSYHNCHFDCFGNWYGIWPVKPVPFIPKSSLSEQMKKENRGGDHLTGDY